MVAATSDPDASFRESAGDMTIESIGEVTDRYENRLRSRAPVVEVHLVKKHKLMTQGAFEFLRATYYRWTMRWPHAVLSSRMPRRCLPWAICTPRTSAPGVTPRAAWCGASTTSTKRAAG
jgi:hypothetical protein